MYYRKYTTALFLVQVRARECAAGPAQEEHLGRHLPRHTLDAGKVPTRTAAGAGHQRGPPSTLRLDGLVGARAFSIILFGWRRARLLVFFAYALFTLACCSIRRIQSKL